MMRNLLGWVRLVWSCAREYQPCCSFWLSLSLGAAPRMPSRACRQKDPDSHTLQPTNTRREQLRSRSDPREVEEGEMIRNLVRWVGLVTLCAAIPAQSLRPASAQPTGGAKDALLVG